MIPKEEEKENLCHIRRDESCERKEPISCVASPHHPGHSAPEQLKTGY
jgi:hypothetical protein